MKTILGEILDCGQRMVIILRSWERKQLCFALLLMIVAAALTSIPPVLLGKLLDHYIESNKADFLYALPFLTSILVTIIVREAIQVCRRYLVEDTCTQVEKRIRVKATSHVISLDFSYLDNQRSGSLNGRLSRSIEGLIKLLKLCFLDFLPSTFIAIFALAVVIYKAPLLGSVMSFVIPIGLMIVFFQISSQRGIRLSLLRGKEDIDGTVVELLGGIENVRAMNTENFEVARVEKISEHLRKVEIKHHLLMAGFDAAKYINEGVFYILVISSSIWLATQKVISIGDILTYSILFMSVVNPLREIHRILDEAHESSLRTQDLFSLLDLPEDQSFYCHSNFRSQNISVDKLAVEIKNLNFSYIDKSSNPIIKNISLRITEGQFIGICGLTGCGKSTLVKLILRLIHLQDEGGSISLFGQALSQLSRKQIAAMVGYVSQNPLLISGSVFENIAYGLQDISSKDVEDAAQKANIHNEILTFSNGYETQVGEKGTKLSGGQRQRITLARIFLRSPRLLILDEATSALDNINEKAVQVALERIMKDRTVISIAHRLTTLKNADCIFVLNEGEVVQSGIYEDLVAHEGFFRLLNKASE